MLVTGTYLVKGRGRIITVTGCSDSTIIGSTIRWRGARPEDPTWEVRAVEGFSKRGESIFTNEVGLVLRGKASDRIKVGDLLVRYHPPLPESR